MVKHSPADADVQARAIFLERPDGDLMYENCITDM